MKQPHRTNRLEEDSKAASHFLMSRRYTGAIIGKIKVINGFAAPDNGSSNPAINRIRGLKTRNIRSINLRYDFNLMALPLMSRALPVRFHNATYANYNNTADTS